MTAILSILYQALLLDLISVVKMYHVSHLGIAYLIANSQYPHIIGCII